MEESEFCSIPFTSCVSENLLNDLEENGFAVLKSALSESDCQAMKKVFQSNLAKAILNPTPSSFSNILNKYSLHVMKSILD
jgi:hypothetical protein